MQIFTCQTGPLSLVLTEGEEDLPPPPPQVRVPRELGVGTTDQVSVKEAEGGRLSEEL